MSAKCIFNQVNSGFSLLSLLSFQPKSQLPYSPLLPSAFAKMAAALLIVDVQKDYYSKYEPVKDAFPDFPKMIESLLVKARGMNDQKLKIVHVREIDNDDSLWIKYWDEMRSEKDELATGEPEEWCRVEEGEQLVIKRAFDAFHETQLHEYLQDNNIKTLYCCGLVTSMCVLHSVMSAFARGYRTYIIGDCCADYNQEAHDAILRIMDGHVARVINLDKFGQSISSKL